MHVSMQEIKFIKVILCVRICVYFHTLLAMRMHFYLVVEKCNNRKRTLRTIYHIGIIKRVINDFGVHKM